MTRLALSALQLLMLIRAILSWFPVDEESKLLRFVYCATEPIIIPIRGLLNRLDFFANMPIDISFMVAYLLISIVGFMLPTVHL